MKKTNNKGFSLVELIVVIAIMAVLVVAVAPQFLKYVERGRKSNDVQSVASIITCVQTYAADPMVTTNKFDANADGTDKTYPLSIGTTETQTSALAEPFKSALTNAGIDSIVLKSSNWGANPIVITFTASSDGSVTAEQTSPTATATVDIVKGLYE